MIRVMTSVIVLLIGIVWYMTSGKNSKTYIPPYLGGKKKR